MGIAGLDRRVTEAIAAFPVAARAPGVPASSSCPRRNGPRDWPTAGPVDPIGPAFSHAFLGSMPSSWLVHSTMSTSRTSETGSGSL